MYFDDPAELEPNIALQEAQRLIFNKGAHIRLDSSPSLDAATVDLDAYTRVLVLLKREQNSVLPCEGCEQHTAPYTPQNFLLLSFETVTHSIASDKCAAPIQLTNPCLKVPESSGLCKDSPVELERVGLRPVHVARKAGIEPIEGVPNEAYEPESVSLNVITASVPTKSIASVKPASRAIEATTARPKVLEPREKCVEWSKLQLLLPPHETLSKPRLPPQEVPSIGICRYGHEVLPLLLQESSSTSKCRPKGALQRMLLLLPQKDLGHPRSLL